MKPRRLIRISVLLAILTVLAVWLEPTRLVWGWLRGEAFYQGRPTSYWAERIRPWEVPEGMRLNVNAAIAAGVEWSAVEGRLTNRPDGQGRAVMASREQIALYVSLSPRESDLRRLVKPWLRLPEIPWPPVLDGDPEARPVLIELLQYDEPGIRDWAQRGLQRIETGQRGPSMLLDEFLSN